jgi:hypothetical protein
MNNQLRVDGNGFPIAHTWRENPPRDNLNRLLFEFRLSVCQHRRLIHVSIWSDNSVDLYVVPRPCASRGWLWRRLMMGPLYCWHCRSVSGFGGVSAAQSTAPSMTLNFCSTSMAEPTYLATANAKEEAANNAARPNAAPTALPRLPIATPTTDTSTDARPRVILLVTMYRTPGPGTTANTRLAKRNAKNDDDEDGSYFDREHTPALHKTEGTLDRNYHRFPSGTRFD